jgi:hypothetical protein
MEAFLEGSQEHRFRGKDRAEVYAWITRTMRVQQYRKQGKAMRGLLKRYMEKMTGRSRNAPRDTSRSELSITSAESRYGSRALR